MAWVYLDDKFHSNPKVLEMGNSGAGLYARALSYCGDHLTDGFVPQSWAKSAASKTLRGKLVECGAWDVVPGGYHIPDYLNLNPSKADVLDKRAKRAAAGAKGGHKRWQTDGKSDSKAIANAMREDGNCYEVATTACVPPNPNPSPTPENPRAVTESRPVALAVVEGNGPQKEQVRETIEQSLKETA